MIHPSIIISAICATHENGMALIVRITTTNISSDVPVDIFPSIQGANGMDVSSVPSGLNLDHVAERWVTFAAFSSSVMHAAYGIH